MNIKTITGSSIHGALAEARRLFGDEVVLLESVPPSASEPARITVVIDGPSQEAAAPAPAGRRTAEEPTPVVPAGYGYGAVRRTDGGRLPAEESTEAVASFSQGSSRLVPARLPDSGPRGGEAVFDSERDARKKAGRGRLFPTAEEGLQPAAQIPAYAATTRLEQLLEAQLALLHKRLDDLERRLDGAIVGASHRWVAHPLFALLLGQGLRPGTVTSLFDALVEKGYDPEANVEELKWALAQEVRGRMAVPASRQTVGTQVFIGPSGTGKTTLVVKLATHPNFFARHKPTVVVILPDEDEAIPYQNPVELYRCYGIPVQSVQTEAEMQHALERLASFDQVLIDTPPMPVDEGQARRMLQRIGRMVNGLMPLEVQFVLSATRTLEGIDAGYMTRLPLRPDAVALTHLDEVAGWGRIAEWLIRLKLPVRFASMGPKAPDDLTAFSPTWFVEQMMALSA